MYYAIITQCPECGKPIVFTQIGVSAEYGLGVNFECTACKKSGGTEFDITVLVAQARAEEGVLLQ